MERVFGCGPAECDVLLGCLKVKLFGERVSMLRSSDWLVKLLDVVGSANSQQPSLLQKSCYDLISKTCCFSLCVFWSTSTFVQLHQHPFIKILDRRLYWHSASSSSQHGRSCSLVSKAELRLWWYQLKATTF